MWRSLFPKQAINRASDFFLLGGDSLMATRCIGELKKLGYIGNLTNLFTHTSLESFALKLSPTKVQQQIRGVNTKPRRAL
ncbi:phosphopantetheine-binding protein [Photobacterium damselae subsp. piscicida]|nr:phosphopantetheine-binding protein [Photobacterium damselae subsp. piscicida]